MSKNSGRFNTTTKTKILTEYGIVLKVTVYNIDEQPYDEYRIRPKCSICGGNVGCICYGDNNFDDPLQSAIDGFKNQWCCEKAHCICTYVKKNNPEKYDELMKIYGNDEWSIAESLQDEFGEDDDGIFCET